MTTYEFRPRFSVRMLISNCLIHQGTCFESRYWLWCPRNEPLHTKFSNVVKLRLLIYFPAFCNNDRFSFTVHLSRHFQFQNMLHCIGLQVLLLSHPRTFVHPSVYFPAPVCLYLLYFLVSLTLHVIVPHSHKQTSRHMPIRTSSAGLTTNVQNTVAQAVTLLTYNRDMPSSKLGRDTVYSVWDFPWVSSVAQEECRETSFKWITLSSNSFQFILH
jgi:hypothetical protein